MDDLIGVCIVHTVFTLVRVFRTIDEQLELKLPVRFDGAQGFLLNINGFGWLHWKIEPDLAVGATVTTFQVKETQMMRLIWCGIPHLSRIAKCLGDCSGRLAIIRILIVFDIAGGEIDAATQRLMDTTQIKHQHIIDEHPHIIVAGKVEHHVLIVDLAVFRHVEIGTKIHTERIFIILSIASKWSEARSIRLVRTTPVAQRELVRCRVICSILGIGVETVIPILAQCQQSASRLVVGDGFIIRLPAKEIVQ